MVFKANAKFMSANRQILTLFALRMPNANASIRAAIPAAIQIAVIE
jgi:hypothetical protein